MLHGHFLCPAASHACPLGAVEVALDRQSSKWLPFPFSPLENAPLFRELKHLEEDFFVFMLAKGEKSPYVLGGWSLSVRPNHRAP